MPRSPTISRAMAAYVVSEVTTLTLSATGARTGGAVTGTWRATSSVVSRSMSVGLVFVWSNRPNRLEGELVRGVEARGLGPGVLRAELDPLALPQRQGRDYLPRDDAGEGIFDIIVVGPRDPALAQLIGRPGIPPEPRGPGAGVFLPQCDQLTPERPLPVQRLRGRPPAESELDPADLAAEARVGVRAVHGRAAQLHVCRAGELPEIEQMD